MTDRDYMLRAIELAEKGRGFTDPNPLVGAVIVKDGRIIGEGYHEIYGSLHAERNAIKHLTESAEGADMYVTLEPCCHYGKQPPCTEAVIASGVKRVVVGSFDPNPQVAGKGTALLREAGIEVVEGFMREECDALNPVFFHFITENEPYIALKYAMTADGKIATKTGKSMWITGETARGHVQQLRAIYPGILVGIGTILADDPMLTCRLEGKRNPVRIVLDTKLRIPLESKLVNSVTAEAPVIVICGEGAEAASQNQEKTREGAEAALQNQEPTQAEVFSQNQESTQTKAFSQNQEPTQAAAFSQNHSMSFSEKRRLLEEKGVEVISVETVAGEVSITAALKELGKRKIAAVLVEGGGNVNASFVKAGKVNCVYTYLGAKIFGGSGKYTPVTGEGIDEVEEALLLENPQVQTFDNDVLVRYEVAGHSLRMR